MRILVNALPLLNVRTGIGRYVDMLYRELSRQPGLEIAYFDGHTIQWSIPDPSAPRPLWRLLAQAYWLLPSPVAALIRSILHWRRERRFLQICKGFDIYHETALLPFRTPTGTKTVLTVHDLGLLRHPQWHPAERARFFDKYFVKRLPWVDGFLAVSDFTRGEMTELLGIGAERVEVSRLGIDLERFGRPAQEAIEAVRRKYALPEYFFLFVGSGDPRKNVQLVRDALRLDPQLPPLVLAGWSGWDDAPPIQGREFRLGYVPDAELPTLYAAATAFVYPSWYEGFGLPLLEAMACGGPVVTTRKASLPGVAGDAALYLENPSDPGELAALLGRVWHDDGLREELGAKGLARAREFPWSKTADATLRLFQRLLLESTPRGGGRGKA
jgi:alpha-1,3-rhamnosyl/mannosyltransferase